MVKVLHVHGGQEEINAALKTIELEGGQYLDLKIVSNNCFILVYTNAPVAWYSRFFSKGEGK